MGPIASKFAGDRHKQKPGAAAIIGNTPLLDLSRLSKTKGVKILAKAEYLNPPDRSRIASRSTSSTAPSATVA